MLLTLRLMPLALLVVRINVPESRSVTYPLTVVPPSWGYSSCCMIAAADNAISYAIYASMLDLYIFRSMSFPGVVLTAGHPCRCPNSYYDTQRDTHARHESSSGWRFHRGPGMWPAKESDHTLQKLLRQEPCHCQGSIDVWTGTSTSGTAKTGGVNMCQQYRDT